MNLSPSNRLTPWVGRLIIANAVVLLLMRTIFTSPALADALAFSPERAFNQPWTFVSYMFVHAGLLHLLFNSLMLFVFGGPVEARMGSRAFILYYLYCGIGAAIFCLPSPGSCRSRRSSGRPAPCSAWRWPSRCTGRMRS
jgi:membrane associated rhomboid family serine protease